MVGEYTRTQPTPPQPSNALATEHEDGKTIIAEGVVAKIAGLAAREVSGVHELVGSGASGAIAGLTQALTRSTPSRDYGVKVQVNEQEAVVDIRMIVKYGASIQAVAEGVRNNVVERLQALAGLTATTVNIEVVDLYFPEEQARQLETETETK